LPPLIAADIAQLVKTNSAKLKPILDLPSLPPPPPAPTLPPNERLKSLGGSRGEDPSEKAGRDQRVPFPVRVQYSAMGQTGSDLAENISARGMFIRTDAPLEVGDTVVINFQVRESAFAMTFPARVKWVTAYGSRDAPVPGMGVEFMGLDDKKRRTLAQIIARLRAEGG
jgi:uncharacterized protein (TIGR02266 family)